MRHLVKTNFEPLFKNFFDMDTPNFGDSKHVPAVNISENDKEYHLEFALAGYNKEDLNINLENDTLTVSAKIETENTTEGEDKNYTRREYRSHSFSRSFYLPEQIKEKAIEASFENGILSLTLPKSEKVKPKQINIK